MIRLLAAFATSECSPVTQAGSSNQDKADDVVSVLFPHISNIKRPHCFTKAFETITRNLMEKSPGVAHGAVRLETECTQTIGFLHLKI